MPNGRFVDYRVMKIRVLMPKNQLCLQIYGWFLCMSKDAMLNCDTLKDSRYARYTKIQFSSVQFGRTPDRASLTTNMDLKKKQC